MLKINKFLIVRVFPVYIEETIRSLILNFLNQSLEIDF